jgi:hypothetical protein
VAVAARDMPTMAPGDSGARSGEEVSVSIGRDAIVHRLTHDEAGYTAWVWA